jgi:flagellar basal body-associated protein FliL
MSHRQNNKSGQIIAETAASMVLLLALGIVILFAVCSLTYAYLVRASLAEAARFASRNLAIAYGVDPTIAQSRAQQEFVVFDKIRIPNIVVTSQQFTNAQFNTATTERFIKVTVRYSANEFGLPPMPLPDPLGFQIRPMEATATYRLE